jgi:hypothetical protein
MVIYGRWKVPVDFHGEWDVFITDRQGYAGFVLPAQTGEKPEDAGNKQANDKNDRFLILSYQIPKPIENVCFQLLKSWVGIQQEIAGILIQGNV